MEQNLQVSVGGQVKCQKTKPNCNLYMAGSCRCSCCRRCRRTLILTQESEIVELFGDVGVILAQDLLADLQRALAERFCVLVFAALAVEHGQVVQRRRHSRMLHAQRLFSDLKKDQSEGSI